MSLRARLTLLVALCVAGAVILISLVAYFATRASLVDQIDETLQGRASFVGGRPVPGGGFSPGGPGDDDGDDRRGEGIASIDVFQVIDAEGNVLDFPQDQDVVLPVSDEDKAVAAGTSGAFFRTVSVDGEEYRVYTSPIRANLAVQAARSLDEVNNTLDQLRNILFVVSIAGVGVAAVVGLVVAHRALRPVSKLTLAAEHVAATQDLSHTIDVKQNDEIGRLAASFNTMLTELDASRQQQRQLVTDASHELRTPLTSLRTNVEVLARADELPPGERKQILDDAQFEINELTKIVAELVELATDVRIEERERADVRLDDVVRSVVERARRRTSLRIELEAQPTLVVGNAELLERATANLVDNATKWSPREGMITVSVRDGAVSVRDQGPGIPVQDLPHVFERFYRSEDARSKPGSGLGLAIVKQIAQAHGGSVRAENMPDGGALVGFSIPPVQMGTQSGPA